MASKDRPVPSSTEGAIIVTSVSVGSSTHFTYRHGSSGKISQEGTEILVLDGLARAMSGKCNVIE